MKGSDYIVEFLISKGITDVFGYPGGMVTYLMDSLDNKKDRIRAHLSYHEQAAAFAACGYGQTSGKVGVAYATSGPGATNLLTGIAHAFFDSVPTLFITGQVNTYEQKGDLGVRQKGFQEMEVVNLVKPISKYAVSIKSIEELPVELNKAYAIAIGGRKGPVVIDLPMNIQREEVQNNLIYHREELSATTSNLLQTSLDEDIGQIFSALNKSQRPLIIAGAGINGSGNRDIFRSLVDKLQIPVVTSMISVDCLPSNSNLKFGFLGAYGHRYANLIVSKCDLIIALGTRLDCRQTGNDKGIFAENAVIIRVDIDQGELTNKIHRDEIQIVRDLSELLPRLLASDWTVKHATWLAECDHYRDVLSAYDQTEGNHIVKIIGEMIPDASVITTDVGQNQVWVAQSLPVKEFQRVLFSGGHGSMGYSFPAAIGAYYASGKAVYSFSGDGGFQMNIQEMQYLARERIPIKIFILNNKSLGMIRHFQEMYFESKFTQTKLEHGYSPPDFASIAQAYGIQSKRIEDVSDLDILGDLLVSPEPALFEISMSDTTFVYPKLAVDKPLYDQEPPLDRNILNDLLGYGLK